MVGNGQAVTRARRHCCIIGDSDTVASVKFIDRLTNHFMAVGELRSAEEYI
jgi:superfamily I DNA and/or RNA helicase